MEMVKWRIAKIKQMFVRKMRLANGDNICKRALTNEIIIGTNGLSKECKDLADEIGLRSVRFCDMSKGEIKRAIKSHSQKTRCEEMMACTKVGDRISDDPKDNTYLTYMTLPNSRLWMRVRARMMKGIKMNHKSPT